MKYLVVLALLLGCTAALAENREIEVIGGGLTYHLLDNSKPHLYSHQVSGDGRLISNPLYGVGYSVSYPKSQAYDFFALFGGENSIGRQVWGGMIGHGTEWKYVRLGWVLGAYIQNDNDFQGTDVVPDSMNRGANAIVPVVGLHLALRLPLGDRYELKMNNIVSPLLTNSTLSLGVRF